MSAFAKLCPACGRASEPDTPACTNCGRTFGSLNPPQEPHDISVAAMLSIFLPGAGQLYNGQKARGLAMLALFVLPLIAGLAFGKIPHALLCAATVWGVSVVDASVMAGRRLRGR